MQKARRYQDRRTTQTLQRSFGGSVLCAVLVSVALWISLLFVVSLIEWLMPNRAASYCVYLVPAIPIIAVGAGAYLGSRRLGKTAFRLGGISGIICWLIGLCIAWCGGAELTSAWLMTSASICLAVSLIGATLGVLHIR